MHSFIKMRRSGGAKRVKSFLVIVFFSVGSILSADPILPTDALKLSIVTDSSSIRKGVVRVGAYFTLKEGWHLYWKNPGEAGLPIRLNLDLSQEVSDTDLRWPLPITFTQPGGRVGYGYEDEVLVYREIKVPETTDTLSLPIRVDWLQCNKKVCVPGEYEGEVEIGGGAESEQPSLFQRWSTKLPSNDIEIDFTVTKEDKEEVEWVIEWAIHPKKVEIYPDYSENISVKIGSLEHQGGVTKITLKVQRMTPSEDRIYALIVFEDEKGERKGRWIPFI